MSRSISDIDVNKEIAVTKQVPLSLPVRVIEKSAVAKVLLVFWVLRLFKPEWIISYYFPALSFLKPIPTIFVIFFCAYLVFSRSKIQYDRPMLFFLVMMLVSTFFSENRGMSYGLLRTIAETFIVSSIFLSVFNTGKGIKKLFSIYAISFFCMGIWGIAGGGRIAAFMPLSDEDSFGPFMAVGFGLTFFIHQAQEKRRKARAYLIVSLLSLASAIASFARGTFVSLVAISSFIFVKSSDKIRLAIRFLVITILSFGLAYVAFPDWMGRYVREVNTIWAEGTSEQTANHRLYLWAKAWDMFKDHPLLGVGPGCYGHRLSMYESLLERDRWGVDRQPYGRAIHNIYFEILSEMGLFGILAFMILIYSFMKRNIYSTGFFTRSGDSNRFHPKLMEDLTSGGFQYYAKGLLAGMLAFLVNGFFFNLLFYTWFWDLLILNSLIYRRAVEKQSAS